MILRSVFAFCFSLAVLQAGTASAKCGNDAKGFEAWKADFTQNASKYGLSSGLVSSTLKGVSYDQKVIRLDRNQKSFKLSFEQFYAKRVNNAMINKAKRLEQQYARLFNKIEKKYGVPAPILLSIWGLETNFGGYVGNMSIIRSLSTLAYDCRRSDFFTNELVNALQIIKRRDMAPEQMRGAWAGEIGQTQFLASSYMKYAVDYDRDGRRDLIRSVPDVLASTANYLKQKGWRAGQSWGPGTANYGVLRQWNKASVYVQTISVMADKISAK